MYALEDRLILVMIVSGGSAQFLSDRYECFSSKRVLTGT